MRPLKSVIANAAGSFWPLQICGWLAYFALNLSALMAEGKPWDFAWYSLGGALSGFMVTSLLRLGYRGVWNLPTAKMLLSAAAMLAGALVVDTKLYTEALFRICDE